MKQLKSLEYHINSRIRAIFRNDKGSITLEAALVMPVLLLFIFVFYIFLIVSSAQMALQSLASSTVQQFASHIHPIHLSLQNLQQHTTKRIPNTTNSKSDQNLALVNNQNSFFGTAALSSYRQDGTLDSSSWEDIVYELSDLLPAPMDVIIQEAMKGNWWPAINMAASTVGREIIEPFIQQQSTSRTLDPERIHLVYLQFPDLFNYTTYHFGVTLEYELPLKIPFTNTPIIIREHALQRVWLPDARAANYELNTDSSSYIYIIGLDPDPVKPGHKATLKAITMPNSECSLEIIYKSGKSVARNLGVQTSNSEGEIEWTWHVSGNTTPGVWELRASTADGSTTVVKAFTVAKK